MRPPGSSATRSRARGSTAASCAVSCATGPTYRDDTVEQERDVVAQLLELAHDVRGDEDGRAIGRVSRGSCP